MRQLKEILISSWIALKIFIFAGLVIGYFWIVDKIPRGYSIALSITVTFILLTASIHYIRKAGPDYDVP